MEAKGSGLRSSVKADTQALPAAQSAGAALGHAAGRQDPSAMPTVRFTRHSSLLAAQRSQLAPRPACPEAIKPVF